jgi:formylmethanofuran dehydrogenase subunit C
VTTSSATVDADGLATREVNRAIKQAIAEGAREIHILHPAGRHSFAVALKAEDLKIVFEGPVGWYAAGMNFGPHVVIQGNCGWAVGECMMDGRIDVLGHAGSGTAASIRGGSVYVQGDSGARSGIAMKGGTLGVGGAAGYIYVGGSVASRGADAEVQDMSDDDVGFLARTLDPLGIDAGGFDFTKIRSGRKLWNFSTKEPELWTSAL